MGLMLATAFALTNCTKDVPQDDSKLEGRTINVIASLPNTKTAHDSDNAYKTVWADGDQLTGFYASAGSTTYSEPAKFTLQDAASGTFTTTASVATGSLDWYFYYPYSSYLTTPAAVSGGYITVANSAPTQTGYDNLDHVLKNLDPLIGVAKNVAEGSDISVQMRHLTSMVKVVVTNTTGSAVAITKVAFGDASQDICGNFYVNFTDPDNVVFTAVEDKVSQKVTLSVSEGDELRNNKSAEFYIPVVPFTAKSGETLTIAVNGYEKSLALTSNVEFKAGEIRTLNFNLDQTPEEETTTFAKILSETASLAKGAETSDEYTVNGAQVMALNGSNVILNDGTADMLYYKSSTGAAVGDIVNVSGTVKNYYWIQEIVGKSYSKVSSGTATYPESPETLDPDAWKAPYTAESMVYTAYYKVSGTLGTDGKTLTVDGKTTTVNLYTTYSDYAGKSVDVYGYPIGVSSKGVINFIPVKAVCEGSEDPEEGEKTLSVLTKMPVKVSAASTSASISIKGTASWTITGLTSGVTADPASFEGAEEETTTKVTFTFAANTDVDAKTYTATLNTTDEVADWSPVTLQITHLGAGAISGNEYKDIINADALGISGTSYQDWSGKTGPSGAVYAGNNSAGTNSDILQMRTTNSNSGVVVTSATKWVKSVTIEWADGDYSNVAGRSLDIYGNIEAFTAPSGLYNIGTTVAKLATSTFDASALSYTYTFDKNYHYVGFRSTSGAIYIKSITVEWSDSKVGEDPIASLEKLSTPKISCTEHSTNSLTFSWGAVENAVNYSVKFNGGDAETITGTSYTATDLTANTSYTITVQAIADGVNYENSSVGSCTYATDLSSDSQGVTFGSDWNTLFGTSYTGTISSVKANSLTLSGSVDGFTLTATNGTSTNGYVKTSDFRVYNGYTIVISAPAGKTIKSMTSVKGGKTFTDGITADTGTLNIVDNGIVWSGSASTVTLSITKTVSFATITVVYE